MKRRAPPPEPADATPPDRIHPQVRYRGVFRISLGVSALLHLVAIAIYPSFFSGIPEANTPFGGFVQPLSPPGTELVNLVELPDDPDPDTPPPPEDEPEPEAPTLSPDARPSGILAPPGFEDLQPPPGPTAAERIRPKGEDLRYWAPVDPELTALTREEFMRLQLIAELETLNDSAALAAELERLGTDWTYTDDEGKKWGVSPGKVHLGDLTIPLPFGFGQSAWQRERGQDRLWAWEEIERGAATGELLRSWKSRDEAIRARRNAERKPDTTRVGGGGLFPPE